MANFDVDPNNGIPDKRVIGRTTSTTNGSTLATPANYGGVSVLRTRLAAANGAYYTAAKLNQMSEPDMVYALRTIDDAASL
jgi:hypothetical protein